MTDTKFGFGTPLVYFPELEGRIKKKFLCLYDVTEEEMNQINGLKDYSLLEKTINEDGKKYKITILVRYLENE